MRRDAGGCGRGDVGMCFVKGFEVVVLLSVGVLLAAVDVDEARAVCWVCCLRVVGIETGVGVQERGEEEGEERKEMRGGGKEERGSFGMLGLGRGWRWAVCLGCGENESRD